MVIYIELYILSNIIIHLYTSFLIRYLLFIPFKKTFLIGLILDVIYSLLYIYHQEYFIIIKYFFPFFLTLLGFKVNFYEFIKVTFLYYLINFLFGGVSLIINLSVNIKLICLLIIFLIITIFIIYYFNINDYKKYIRLRFVFKNKKYCINAFCDSGCNLMYKLLPVIVLHQKYQFNIKTQDKIEIDNGYSKYLKECYYLNEIYIDKRKISCYVIFLDIKYDAIVGYL